MRHKLIICIIIFVKNFSYSKNNVYCSLGDSNFIYSIFDEKPFFKAGNEALEAYIQKYIGYSTEQQSNTILVNFIIYTDGSIQSPTIINGGSEICDKKVISLIMNMPSWVPAKVEGKAVRFRNSMRINCGVKENLDISNKIENNIVPISASKEIKKTENSNKKTYSFVEVMPEYPFGEAELFKYLSEHLKYPDNFRKNGVEGTVQVRFVVDTDGSIQNVVVSRGMDGGFDEEAIKVVASMPNWKPGTQDGIPVRVSYTVPIRFRL